LENLSVEQRQPVGCREEVIVTPVKALHDLPVGSCAVAGKLLGMVDLDEPLRARSERPSAPSIDAAPFHPGAIQPFAGDR